ncbi:hypothetical protein [uncultured Hoeflea sp.]|uniref:hypothetical protein n=1 Tax=uncultured Hoeflea sp. TaxID=538666 RepID=UPI00261319DA|nr:hypothetical protein [uncultured Hoeflea sp.]
MRPSPYDDAPDGRHLLPWLYALLAVFVAVLALMQTLPLVLPIGPMYWDVLVYYDAIGRIWQGQAPVHDFFAPVGPLEYYLAAFSAWLFPEANPVLLTQWIWLPVTVPVMALILWDVAGRGLKVSLGLLLPFMLVTALPFNVIDFYPYPGTDGFGIYNRHGAHLLYLLTAAVLFVRSPVIQTIVLSVLLLSAAFCKITAFLAAGPILLFGLLLGRIRLTAAIAAALICIGLTGVVELTTGIVSLYVRDIILLASENTHAVLPRFLTAISQHFNVMGAGGLLAIVLLAAALTGQPAAGGREDGNGLARAFDAPWFWVGLLLVCGLFYETQNTGSHAFILLWPALLMILARPLAEYGRFAVAILVLAGFTAIPDISGMLHKASRTAAVAPGYVKIDAPDLGPIGRASAKPIFVEQAERMRGIYVAHRETYAAIAETEALPSFLQFSDPDFQYLLLSEMQAAVVAIKQLEARSGRRFETVLNLDFANPFPFILERKGAYHVAIGADPYRALPELSEETRAAVAATDLVLSPVCPLLHSRKLIKEHYAPALTDHDKIALTPCFDAYLREQR